jgi:hypothetical protein
VRVLAPDKTGCYAALGVLHGLYKPIPGKFKHRDSQGQRLPVANDVRSVLHATGCRSAATCTASRKRASPRTGSTVRGALDLAGPRDAPAAEPARDPVGIARLKEFLEHQGRLFPDEVYVFTPKGKIMALPPAHGRRLRLHRAHRHRSPPRRRPDQLRALPLRIELKNGDHVESDLADRAPQSFVAFLVATARVAHSPLPRRACSRGIGALATLTQGSRRSWRSQHHLGTLGCIEGIRREEPARALADIAPASGCVRRRASADALAGRR